MTPQLTTLARRSAVFTAVFSAAVLARPPAAAEDGAWRPEIPKVWDDEAIASLELPLPAADYSPRHVSSSYYYAIPTLEIYKSYPVYAPAHEPPDYWKWLEAQEPEVAFDASTLVTKEDWIRAGELVFNEGHEYSTGIEMEFVRDPRAFEAARMPVSADGTIPYARYFIRDKGKVELGVNACAACHTRVLPGGSVLLGGPGDFPLGPVIASEMRTEIAKLPEGVEPPEVDETWSDYRNFAAPWLDPDPAAFVLGMSLADLATLYEAMPHGVMARERTSLLTPVRVADLIGIEGRPYLDATGLIRHRSIGDLMRYAALNQGGDELSSYGGFIAGVDEGESLPDPVTLTRYSDEQLYALALFIYSLEPPPSPHPVDAAAERGRAIFESEGCASCHRPPAYTNDRLTPATGFDPPEAHRDTLRLTNRRVGTDPGLTMRTRRGTGYYKVPSLRGAWYKGPFFHDGSVSGLEDVFDPGRLADDYVPTGFRGAGVERRAVPGHEFGLDLTEEERACLVAFLRTL